MRARDVATSGATFSGLARFGITVLENPDLRAATVVYGFDGSRAGDHSAVVVVGTRPETEAEFAGRWASWHVRRLYDDAGVLRWLGEPLDSEPARDDLAKDVARMTGWLS